MHQSSKDKMALVAQLIQSEFIDSQHNVSILDIGTVEPSYQDIFESTIPKSSYETMNIDFGFGNASCSLLVKEAYNWKEIASESYDVVISGQTFEHIEFFWLTILEIQRVLKKGGICAIIAPSHWPEHRAPHDCYRFYADGLLALAKFSGLETIYAYAEHKELVKRACCDAILVAKKPQKIENDADYRNAHMAMLKLLPSNDYLEISRNKPTFQSSSSKWEKPEHIKTIGGATSGLYTGNYSFHTQYEENAFWGVDLLQVRFADHIKIFNRKENSKKIQHFDIMLSTDMLTWEKIHTYQGTFGGVLDGNPFTCKINKKARYIRIQSKGKASLSYDQIAVFEKLTCN